MPPTMADIDRTDEKADDLGVDLVLQPRSEREKFRFDELHAVGEFGQSFQDRLALNCLRLIPAASHNHADAILQVLESLFGGLELQPKFVMRGIDDASELLFVDGG